MLRIKAAAHLLRMDQQSWGLWQKTSSYENEGSFCIKQLKLKQAILAILNQPAAFDSETFTKYIHK